VLAATNRPWDIDSALLRPGRFSEKILIPLPDKESRKAIVKAQLKGIPVEKDVTPELISTITEGFNGADVVEFCDQLKNGPIMRTLKTKSSEEKITKEDVETARKKVKSSVSKDDMEALEEFERNNS
jgi:transitional endoplasmic reticulum ATPase